MGILVEINHNLLEATMNTPTVWRDWLSANLDLSAETVDRLVNRFQRANLADDPETLEHSQRATLLACQLAERTGLPADQRLSFRRGALLHDLGKLLIPPEILAKSEPLTAEDWAVLKRHPTYSYLLLCDIPELEPALDIPTAHHERWDGSGYPRGLKGEAIPLAARIYMLVDVWDALLSPRPFRPAFAPVVARDIMENKLGGTFDPLLLSQFIALISEK
jgi:HD-GYP domain-containing protein (c-di-GMP phosphodiesterase class II)